MSSETLTSIYRAQPAARKLFAWILDTEVEDKRTTVEDLMDQCDVSRRQSIAVLRALADAGYGEFKVGRKGHPSRLEWAADPRMLAERLTHDEATPTGDEQGAEPPQEQHEHAATPARHDPRALGELFIDMFPDEEPPAASEQPPRRPRRRVSAREAELIEHSYVLRPKLRIVVELPEDLSAREAEVLGEWIKNLSFER